MSIVYYDDSQKYKWNAFVIANAINGGILQSWEWGNFQKDVGRRVWRVGVIDDKQESLAVCLAVLEPMALGMRSLYVPHGPIFGKDIPKTQQVGLLIELLKELKDLARRNGALVVRLDLHSVDHLAFSITSEDLTKLKLRPSYKDIQPRSTILIDLKQSLDKIFAGMKPKTRYNIRLAAKKGIAVTVSRNVNADFAKFWQIMRQTSKRNHFGVHSKDYYQSLLRNLQLNPNEHYTAYVQLYLARFNDEVIAAIIVGVMGKRAVYLHGASSDKHRELMAPYFLQSRAITDAKTNGCSHYDLGGIKSETTKNATQKSWQGVTRFKQGFASDTDITDFLGVWEAIVHPIIYRFYKILRWLSCIIRF